MSRQNKIRAPRHPNPKTTAKIASVKKVIGEKLRALRKEKGVTIKVVASALRFSPSRVGRLERGEDPVWLTDFFAIAQYYKVAAHTLYPKEKEFLGRSKKAELVCNV
jgi:transcriptional regulator with XRE-family HTH domain